MISVDFHSHTLFSACGVHSHIEMLVRARDLGMAGLAITDHGREQEGSIPSTFFDRLSQPVSGIRLIKGIEANLRDLEGEIDIPRMVMPHLDLVLLGIHPNTPRDLDTAVYTRALLAALERNPCIDMLTHLDSGGPFPVELRPVVRAAKSYGVLIELNNSKLLLNRIPVDRMRELVRVCKEEECPMAIGSDAHVLNELGRDEHARALLAEEAFPDSLWVNQTEEKAFAFIESRRANKQ